LAQPDEEMPVDSRIDQLLSRWEHLREQGEGVSAEQLCADCPALLPEVRRRLQALGAVDRVLETAGSASSGTTTGEGPPGALGDPASAGIPGYEVLDVLGRGGMGIVYRARQVALRRVVALKMILEAHQAGQRDRARFRTEAQAIARLQRPNIVAVGGLDKRLGTPLPPRPAALLVEALARGVQHAHERGVSPANVLLASGGRQPPEQGAPSFSGGSRPPLAPKITDFGLARALDEAEHTRTGAVLGTPTSTAPEQAEGKKDVGPPADLYALGAILYECLTGSPPFRGLGALDTLYQVRHREPVPPRSLQPGVPRDPETVCLKCLAKDPKKRYPGAAELADDLRSSASASSAARLRLHDALGGNMPDVGEGGA
jgi:serine/threonine-protein kinase